MSRGGVQRDTERCLRMAELYRNGMTLQEIGTAFGITRERVRQIVKREGVTRTDGGLHQRYEARKARLAKARKEKLDRHSRAWFGCDHDTLLRLNDGKRAWSKGRTRARPFIQQKRSAAARGIEWQLTFPEWCRLWDESGKWEQRGRGRDGYCMARKQDFGPYAVWNVYITTCAENVADYQRELKLRGVVCQDGYKRLPERAAELGVAQ